MSFKPKLMAFDLDGTLAESKQRLPADMGEELALLMQVMPVAVMSGASFKQFGSQFLPALPGDANFANLYIFPTNAAQCFVYKENSWQAAYDHSFTAVEREVILQALAQCIEETHFDNKSEQLWGAQIEDRGAQISFSALGQSAPVEEKTKWKAANDGERKKLYAALVKKLPGLSIAMGGLTTIDITRHGINKAYGVRQLASLTGISVPEMLYVGDALEEGGNDSVVIETGVHTHQVLDPKATFTLIEEILKK
jgi:phosphomannomutase